MRLTRYLLRPGLFWIVCVFSFCGQLLVANPADAGTTTTTSNRHSPSELAAGLLILGGTITGSGPESGRTLDSGQATAFMQAWLPDSIFGSPPYQNPPSNLPVYDVEVQDKYLGTLNTMTVDYVSDGKSAWISMPPQSLWPGVIVTQQRWILAPDRTVAAFEGHVAPVPVRQGKGTQRIGITANPPNSATTSQGSLSTAWILVIAGVVVVGSGVAIMVVRRRRGSATKAVTRPG
jgi:hypothetical protein